MRFNKKRYSKTREAGVKDREFTEQGWGESAKSRELWDNKQISTVLNLFFDGSAYISPNQQTDIRRASGRSYRSIETMLWELAVARRGFKKYCEDGRLQRTGSPYILQDLVMFKRETSPYGVREGAHLPRRIAIIHARSEEEIHKWLAERAALATAMQRLLKKKGESEAERIARLVRSTLQGEFKALLKQILGVMGDESC